MDSKTKILIGIPTMGDININLATRLIYWAKKYEKGVVNFFFTYKVSPVDRARNQIVDYFLKHDELTHLFFIDSDTIPPQDALQKLLDMDKDIATGMTPMLHFDKDRNAWGTFFNAFSKEVKENGEVRTVSPEPNVGLVEVERCGGSCLMIKREVFGKLKVPYFQFILQDHGRTHVKSEDIYFCDTAREAGMEIWCDTSVICQHHKAVML